MARPPKTTEQHLLDGTWREDRHGGRPEYPAGAPPRPPSVEALPAAVAYWDYHVEQMTLAGTLRETYTAVLAQLCVLCAIRDGLVAQLAAAGSFVVASEVSTAGADDPAAPPSMTPQRAVTLSVHPLAKEIRALTPAIRGLAAELGLSPVSSARAGTNTGSGSNKGNGDDGKPVSRFAELQAAGRQLRAG